jgi:hypothetical protein
VKVSSFSARCASRKFHRLYPEFHLISFGKSASLGEYVTAHREEANRIVIDRLHQLPIVMGAVIVCFLFLVPTLIGSALLQPAVGRLLRDERDPNTVVGLLLNAFSLYYGVLLALLSIAVFENYGKAQDAVGREASSIIALYRTFSGYPEATRTSLSDTLRQYVDEETGPGWASQRSNQASTRGTLLVDQLSRQLLGFRPNRDAGEDLIHQAALRIFEDFIEQRRLRIQAAGTSIPRVIWSVVIVGAGLNVFILWLFDLKRTTHFLLGGVLMIFVGLVVYMVSVLDRPFHGAHGLQPDDLVQARQQMIPRP